MIGKPNYVDIMSIESESATQIINSINFKKVRPFESFFPDCDPEAL